MEKSRITVHFHIAVVMRLQKKFDRHLTKTFCQTFSREDLFQESLALKVLEFRVLGSLLARFRVRNRNYLSVRFIFGIPEVTLKVLGAGLLCFSSNKKKRFECFSLGQNCHWFSRPRRQRRGRDNTRVVLCSWAGFFLSADPSSIKSNSFLICPLEVGFLWTKRPAMRMPVFLRPLIITNALITYLSGQR